MPTAAPDARTDATAWSTADRPMLRQAVRRFVDDHVRPLADELDSEQGQIPQATIDQMAGMGLFGILIPTTYGGLGLGAYEYCLVSEELARGWLSVASIIGRANGAFSSLFTEEQRREHLPRQAKGDFFSAVAVSEPEAGSDIASMTCRATRSDEGWLLNGSKMWCTFADRADYLLVFARTSPTVDDRKRHRGISAFMIPKERESFPPGVEAQAVRKIGYHGWDTFDLFFDDLRLPQEALVGEEGRAFYGLMADLDVARVHTAARSVGLAQAALDDAIKYAQEREQFGQAIARFQAIRFKIASMATELESARQLTYNVAEQIDAGEDASTKASMAKLFASEVAERVCSEALQIHGGAGYTTDFSVERYWRDARLTKIFEGTSEIQLRVVSDALLGR